MKARFLGAVAVALVFGGCGNTSQPGPTSSGPRGSITVFAASSLTAAFGSIGVDFQRADPGTMIHFAFAGSSTLVAQIQQGAIGDVFASADQPDMQKLVNAGLTAGSPLWPGPSSGISTRMASRHWRAMASSPRKPRRLSAPPLFVLLAGVGAAFFLLPLAGLLVRTPWGSAWQLLTSSEAITALRLSLLASLSATVIAVVLGVPLAWMFARIAFPGRAVLRALTVLPMVLPPAVGGAALLAAFC